jgi:polysaccharide export outer membrane protein
MTVRILTALLALALAACASSPPLGGSSVVVAQAEGLPPPTRTDLLTSSSPYLIGPFDKLHIDVFGIEDLQRDVQIDASGRLSFPLIGVVEAAGVTPDELATVIRDRLQGQFVRDPQVTVNLVETVSQVVTVDGQVNQPGLYPVVGRMTLMRAVATAGGVGEFAKLSDVVIFRSVDGQQMVGLYNLEGIRRGNYPDPQIYANDVVVVSTSEARRLFKDIIQGSSLITTPLIIALRSR